MLRLRVLDAARHEFADTVRVCREHDPDFARRLVDAYRALIRRTRRFPKLGTIEPEYSDDFEVRRHLLRGYHHKVIVAEVEDELVVVAVAHERRSPGYWAERLRELKARG